MKLQCCFQCQQAAAAMSAGWCSRQAAHLVSVLLGDSNAACCACWGCPVAGSARHDLLHALLPLSFEHACPHSGRPPEPACRYTCDYVPVVLVVGLYTCCTSFCQVYQYVADSRVDLLCSLCRMLLVAAHAKQCSSGCIAPECYS